MKSLTPWRNPRRAQGRCWLLIPMAWSVAFVVGCHSLLSCSHTQYYHCTGAAPASCIAYYTYYIILCINTYYVVCIVPNPGLFLLNVVLSTRPMPAFWLGLLPLLLGLNNDRVLGALNVSAVAISFCLQPYTALHICVL